MHHTPQEINKFWDKKRNPLDNILKIYLKFIPYFFYEQYLSFLEFYLAKELKLLKYLNFQYLIIKYLHLHQKPLSKNYIKN